jgi:hypothetical protein
MSMGPHTGRAPRRDLMQDAVGESANEAIGSDHEEDLALQMDDPENWWAKLSRSREAKRK